MAESKPKKSLGSKPKVFDVAHPKNNVASPTSRPVIVGHTNMIQKDPMVSPVETSEITEKDVVAQTPAGQLKRERIIQPDGEVSEQQPGETSDKPTDSTGESAEIPIEDNEAVTQDLSASEEPAVEEPEAEDVVITQEEPESESDAEIVPDDDTESVELDESQADTVNSDSESGTGAVDALVAGVNTKKERKDQEEKEAKRQEEIQAMIASKKYNVKTHIPPGKRNIIWLIILIIAVILGGAGWYVGVGPGRSLWDKKPVASVPAAQTQASTSKTETPTTPTTKDQASAKTTIFNDPKYGISFSYPSDWKVQVAKDKEFSTRDIITLTSPSESLKTTASDTTQVDTEVFLRTRIVVENTKNATEYASDLVNLTSCESEDIIATSTALKLLYVDATNKSPSVSQVSLSSSNCVAAGTKFAGNDQIQLSKKASTYVIYTEYVFSDAYLKQNGTTTSDAIALAQESGVAAAKASVKAGKNFIEFQDLVKSLKEL